MLGAAVIRGRIANVLEHEATSKLNIPVSQVGKPRLREVRDFPKVNWRVGDTVGLPWLWTYTTA